VREPLGPEFVLTMGPEHHIRVYPMMVWEALGIELTTGGLEMELNPDRVRLQRLFGNCEYASTDPQNRLSIPKHLRDWATLDDNEPVVIIGNGTRLEIWNRTKWKEYAAKSFESEQEIGQVAARLAGSIGPPEIGEPAAPITIA
jgi:MraZ protein